MIIQTISKIENCNNSFSTLKSEGEINKYLELSINTMKIFRIPLDKWGDFSNTITNNNNWFNSVVEYFFLGSLYSDESQFIRTQEDKETFHALISICSRIPFLIKFMWEYNSIGNMNVVFCNLYGEVLRETGINRIIVPDKNIQDLMQKNTDLKNELLKYGFFYMCEAIDEKSNNNMGFLYHSYHTHNHSSIRWTREAQDIRARVLEMA